MHNRRWRGVVVGIGLVLALGVVAGGGVAARQFSPEITLAINQLVTGVTPFTAFRTAASSYLNWGSTQGESGYGIRDSAGTMQVKNSAGSWASIVTGATLPTAASFITRVAEGALSNETALGGLATGVLVNTTTTGVPTIYAGAACTNQFVRALSASAAATCASVSLTADVTGTLPVSRGGTGLASGVVGGVVYFPTTTSYASSAALAVNQLVIGGGAGGPGPLGTTGTAATVLHGNGSGAPSFTAVNLTTTVTGILPGANGGTGSEFMVFAGPASTVKTYTLPNASATILTSAAAITPAQGGTGLATYAVGDVIYASGTATLARLADIATGNALISGGIGVAPSWGKINLSTHVSGTLAVVSGGTSFASYTAGDQIYASGATTLTRVGIGASGSFWRSTGSAPAWSTLVLPNAATTGDLLQATSANTLAALSAVATGNALVSGGVGTASAWGKIGLATHVSGTLAAGNGGLGITTTTDDATIVGSGSAWVSTVLPSAANGLAYNNSTNTFSALTAPTFASVSLVSLADTATPPTINSGFGTGASVPAHNGTAAFTVNVGTGGTASNGILTMPASAAGWVCRPENQTALLANVADQRTVQIASSTTSVTIENQTVSTGAAVAWTSAAVLTLTCRGY